jgi:hypothetical protein
MNARARPPSFGARRGTVRGVIRTFQPMVKPNVLALVWSARANFLRLCQNCRGKIIEM